MTPKQKEKFWKDLATGKFARQVQTAAPGQAVNNGQELYNIITPVMAQSPDREQFWVVFLSAKNQIVSVECLFVGTLSSSAIYPREIIRRVLDLAAAAVIFVHNHPSGDPAPSSDDQAITRHLLIAMSSVGVTVHDHLIIGREEHYSMAEKGLIPRLRREYDQFIGKGSLEDTEGSL